MTDGPAETPMGDHVNRALILMRMGSRMTLENASRFKAEVFPAEVGKEIARQLGSITDKAENVLIARGMGWPLDDALEELAKVTPLSGEATSDCQAAPATRPETIVAAAVQIEGLTVSLPRPAGHGEVLALMADGANGYDPGLAGALQGFLTSEGRFVSRVEAMKIAHRAGQSFRTPQVSHQLFSENLW